MNQQPSLDFGVHPLDAVNEARLREMRAVAVETEVMTSGMQLQHVRDAQSKHTSDKPGAAHPVKNTRTQCSRILALLEGGEWVPAYKLSDVALQYNARIWQLRRRGYQIENRTEEVDGVVHSAYRLVVT